MIPELIWAFVTGLAGSLHCLGMCGPLVVAYSLQLRPGLRTEGRFSADRASSGSIHHLIFHLGRIVTYGFLGVLGAGLFYLGGDSAFIMWARNAATLAGGALIVLLGLVLLRVVPVSFTSTTSLQHKKTLAERFIRFGSTPKGHSSDFGLGLATGFLPCMLSWAMIIKAASTGSLLTGFLFMVFFGSGTIPVLFSTGFFASLFSLRLRLAGERVAAISVIIMGLILLLKGAARLV